MKLWQKMEENSSLYINRIKSLIVLVKFALIVGITIILIILLYYIIFLNDFSEQRNLLQYCFLPSGF